MTNAAAASALAIVAHYLRLGRRSVWIAGAWSPDREPPLDGWRCWDAARGRLVPPDQGKPS